jgi:hypothetical protein
MDITLPMEVGQLPLELWYHILTFCKTSRSILCIFKTCWYLRELMYDEKIRQLLVRLKIDDMKRNKKSKVVAIKWCAYNGCKSVADYLMLNNVIHNTCMRTSLIIALKRENYGFVKYIASPYRWFTVYKDKHYDDYTLTKIAITHLLSNFDDIFDDVKYPQKRIINTILKDLSIQYRKIEYNLTYHYHPH